MKSLPFFVCTLALASMASIPVPRQDAAKPAEPAPVAAATDAATGEFFKRVDEVHFHYPGAGVHSLTMRMKIGSNPMMPAEMREKLKDAAVVYYWQQEPWKEAIDVTGIPSEMATMKAAMLGRGVGSMRQMVAHSYVELAKHFTVKMSQDGEQTKLEWTPREGQKDFSPMTLWFDRNAKLVKGQIWSVQAKKSIAVDFALVPLGTKYALAEIKQSPAEGGPSTRLEWGKKGDLPVLVKISNVSGPMKLDFPVEVEVNAKIDDAVFATEKPQ